MKRIMKLTAACLAALWMTACGQLSPNTYELEGEIKGLANDTLYLYGTDNLYPEPDTVVVENGKFKSQFPIDTLATVNLLLPNGTQYPLFVEGGTRIRIEGEAPHADSLRATGTEMNNDLTTFRQRTDSVSQRAEAYIYAHPNSLVSLYLIEQCFVNQPHPDYARIKELCNSLSNQMKDRAYITRLTETLKPEEKATVGHNIPFFRLSNPKGESITRNRFSKQYVLMHFWASWDNASRQDLAYYKRLYKEQKKNASFTLLGLSLDTNKKEWTDAIERDTLQWEQVCDFKVWECETVQKLNIRTLPANVLISPTGRIEARDLTPAQVEIWLEKIAKEEKNKKK